LPEDSRLLHLGGQSLADHGDTLLQDQMAICARRFCGTLSSSLKQMGIAEKAR